MIPLENNENFENDDWPVIREQLNENILRILKKHDNNI